MGELTTPLGSASVLRLVGIDPGTRRIGLAALTWDRPTQHADIAAAHQVDVDPEDLPTAAAQAFAWAIDQGAQGIVVEHGPFYGGRPRSYEKHVVDAFLRGLVARERNHALMGRFVVMIEALAAHAGIRVRIVGRASWAHRVVLHARQITDEMIANALDSYLDAASMAHLTTPDRRDAAGAVLWSVLPEPVRAPRRRDGAAPQARRVLPVAWRSIEGKRSWRLASRRLKWAVAYGGVDAAARLAAPCPCGPHGRGRRPASCPRAAEKRRAAPGVCACGVALRSAGSTWCPGCVGSARAAAQVEARGGSKMEKRRAEETKRREKKERERWGGRP